MSSNKKPTTPTPTPPRNAQEFKPYNPQSTRVVHRRSSIEDAPSLIGGKLYEAGYISSPLTSTSPIKEKL
jgi:hypothetical protein